MEGFDFIVDLLRLRLKYLEPFVVKLEKFGKFDHSRMKLSTIFLEPETEEKNSESFNILSKIIYETLRDHTNQLSDFISSENKLHVSLGKKKQENADKFIEEFQKNWIPTQFLLSEIHLLTKSNAFSNEKDNYIVRKSIPLGYSYFPSYTEKKDFFVEEFYKR